MVSIFWTRTFKIWSRTVGLVLNQMITAPADKEQEEIDWDEEYNDTMGSLHMGRSQITGY